MNVALPKASTLSLKHRLWAMLALGLLIHAGFGWLLTLSVDEAHYMLYADKLDWSYFDHPPLVGWIQWPLVSIGAPDAVIRLIPQLLWLISCLLARSIALNLYRVVPGWNNRAEQQAAGLWAVALVLLAPLMHVLAVGLLPDTLLMALTLALIKVTLSLSQKSTLGQWICLGILLGLAGLAKYTAILPALAVVIILFYRHKLKIMLYPATWVAVFLACVMVLPVFYWNAQHEWISFVYQIKHGTGGTWQLRRIAAFFGIQLVAYGPLLFLGTYLAFRHIFQRKAVFAGLLLLFFVIPFSVTAYLAGGGGSLPHWTAPAWLAAIPFAANALSKFWFEGHKALLTALVRTQAVICILAFSLLFFIGIPGISQQHSLGKKNPLADLWGWEIAGARARDLAQNLKLDAISVKNWTLASRMAWYSRPTKIFVLDNRFDQFDLWFGDISAGSDSIFVNWSQMRFDLPTGPGGFESCTLIDQLDVLRLGRLISDFSFYHCRNWGAAVAPNASGKPS